MEAEGGSWVLIVFYSFTEQTRKAADTMAEALRADGHHLIGAALEPMPVDDPVITTVPRSVG